MEKVRIRKPAANPPNGSEPQAKAELTPLRVSGVVVDKAALVEALRVYVPALADIRVTEDGDHFWLMLDAADAPIPSPFGERRGLG